MKKAAEFSDCRKYRYTLTRYWDETKPYCMFVCLNPSTADETKDDPTVRRCINYSKDWGFGGFIMVNLFAFRATDPKDMKAEYEPIGKHNDAWIKHMSYKAGIVVAAWGTHGVFLRRNEEVLELLKGKLYYLELSKDLHPKHPLYLKKILKPKRWIGTKEKWNGKLSLLRSK
jgi:hypothetical protein